MASRDTKSYVMLAGKVSDVNKLRYPLWASPKIDGVRAYVKDGIVLSRSGKPIPNKHVQQLFKMAEGFDGELICGDATDPDVFRNTSSAVMTIEGTPDVKFIIFDIHTRGKDRYVTTFNKMSDICCFVNNTEVVETRWLGNADELLKYESEKLSQGYEGVMVRSGESPYKHGRSTEKEGYILKLKRFVDSEAVIQGMFEEIDIHGKPKGRMGHLCVTDIHTGVDFEIGTGFTAKDRETFWNAFKDHNVLVQGTIIKYKSFPYGVKDRPRFPVYLGIRDEKDM